MVHWTDEYLPKSLADILITDTNADLNVYLDTDVDGTTKKAASSQCCGIASQDKTAASCQPGKGKNNQCCAANNKEDASQEESDEKAGGCGSCGGGKLGDLNKWAGKFVFSINPTSLC